MTWESIYVKIIMLKTVITNENGYGGTLKGVLFSSLHSSQAASKSWSPLSFSAEKRKGGIYLNPKNVPPVKKPENKLKRHIDCGRILYTAFLCMCMASMLCLPAFAAGTTIWTKASEVMKDVYTQVLGISTIACLAQTHHRHMDYPELPRLHHELCHSLLLRRPVHAVRAYGYLRWHSGVDRGTNHVRPGYD